MRKFAALGLLLAAALFATVSMANATDGDASAPAPDSTVGVQYEWWGDVGMLSIVGQPGSFYEVYDAMGQPIAGGTLDGAHVSFVAGNSGVGPDGTIVFVRVNDEVVAVTDPDWEWN